MLTDPPTYQAAPSLLPLSASLGLRFLFADCVSNIVDFAKYPPGS